MFHIVLVEPEIPPNTGNIIRLCVNIGARLSLIEPLGFALEHKSLSRSAMDYREKVQMEVYSSIHALFDTCQPKRVFAATTKAQQLYTAVTYQPGDLLIFGPESRGLDKTLLDILPDDTKIRIPMNDRSRSLNLANAVAVVAYEAWRQNGFGEGV